MVRNCLTAGALLLWFLVALPRAPKLPPPPPTLATPPPAATCGVALHLLAALPAPARGQPELVWLQNAEPIPLHLAGFQLIAGRQRRPLPDRVLAPGEHLTLPAPRLRDRDGAVRLVDPCGVSEVLSWDRAERGVHVRSALALALGWRSSEGAAMVHAALLTTDPPHAL